MSLPPRGYAGAADRAGSCVHRPEPALGKGDAPGTPELAGADAVDVGLNAAVRGADGAHPFDRTGFSIGK